MNPRYRSRMSGSKGRPLMLARPMPVVIRRRPPPTLSSRQKNQVKRLIANRQELKYFHSTYSSNPSAVPSIFPFLAPTIGTSGTRDTERDGDMIYYKRTEIRFQASILPGITSDEYNKIRLIVFQWKEFDGLLPPSATSILLPGPSTVIDILSPYNHDQRQNFKVLLDRVFTLVGNGISSSQPFASNATIFRKFLITNRRAIKKMQFNGATTDGTNKLFFMVFSDSSGGTHPSVQIDFKSYFTDS